MEIDTDNDVFDLENLNEKLAKDYENQTKENLTDDEGKTFWAFILSTKKLEHKITPQISFQVL